MPGLEGTTLGHYQVLGRLGRGGMSEVYLAYDEQHNRNVALKVVSSSQTDYLERFQRETDAIRRLHHDHILPAFDSGNQEPWHYLVMPFVEQGTLRDILDIGPMTMQHADELLQQIANALQRAHDNGIIHRDIKPSNILLRDKHYAYLADFGLAKELEGASSITQTGALLGTPEYMAPDLADGPATTSSDVYALGVMLYQMVTGRVPFTGETPVSVFMKHLREQPIPPSFYNAKIPRSVDQVVLHALEKDPHRRFQSPQELAASFHRALTMPSVHDTQEMSLSSLPVTPSGISDTPLPSTRRYGRQARQARQARQNRTPSSANRRFIIPANQSVTSTPISTQRPYTPHASPVITDPLPQTALSTLPAIGQVVSNEAVSIAESLSQTEQQHESATSATPLRPKVARGTHPNRNRRPNLSLLAFSIIAVGLLLFIVLPMTLIYYNYITHPHPASVVPTAVPTAIPTVVPTSPSSETTPTSQGKAQTASTVSTTAIAATSGTPIMADLLASDTNSRWIQDGTHCFFSNGSYNVYALHTNDIQNCALTTPQFSDDSFEVDATLLTGSNAGMLFRANNDQFYDFEITSQGQFFFRRHDGGAGSTYVYLLNPTTSAAIAPMGQKNTLLVIAKGSTMQLFINNVAAGTVNDNAYAQGQVAFVCGTLASQSSGQASFTNFKVFNL